MTVGGSGRSYVRAVEAAWTKLAGRPVVVSPREYEAIEDWRRRGIPLSIVLEALTSAAKRRSGRVPRSLGALGPAVEEAFAVVAAGRSARDVGAPRPAHTEARRAWEAALAAASLGTPLHSLLARLLADDARGEDPRRLDADLDAALPAAVPGDVLDQATEDTRRRLAAFRDRMSEDEFRGTLARALTERLRLELVLPRMSLTR